MYIVDISNPSALAVEELVPVENVYESMAVKDSILIVGSNYTGVNILNIADPSNPIPRAITDTSKVTRSIVFEGQYAYLLDAFRGLIALDVSDPGTPVAVGQYPTGAYSEHMVLRNDTMFIANEDTGLLLVAVGSSTPVERVPSAPQDATLEIFPQPVTGRVHLQYTLGHASDIAVEVFTASGKQVGQIAYGPMGAGTHTLTWDPATAGLPAGSYFIRMSGSRGAVVQKMIVVK